MSDRGVSISWEHAITRYVGVPVGVTILIPIRIFVASNMAKKITLH